MGRHVRGDWCAGRADAAQPDRQGQEIDSALFENNVFLVGQHMVQYAVTGQPAAPMPERISSWGVYDVFSVHDRRADIH